MLYHVQSPFFKFFLKNSKLVKESKTGTKKTVVEDKRGQVNPGSVGC